MDSHRQLRNNTQRLDTMGKLADVKGKVRSTLDKLEGIKPDLVWGFQRFACTNVKIIREIHSADENTSDARSQVNNTVVYPVVIVDVEGVNCRALLDTGRRTLTIQQHYWRGWKECFNVTNMLLPPATSRIEYEELCRQDVLVLEDKFGDDQSGAYDEFKNNWCVIMRDGTKQDYPGAVTPPPPHLLATLSKRIFSTGNFSLAPERSRLFIHVAVVKERLLKVANT